MRGVRALLGDVLWKLETGEMEPGLARVTIYAASVLANVLQGSELEERLASLESEVRKKGGRR